MQAVDSICRKSVAVFLDTHLIAGQMVKTDAPAALNTPDDRHEHLKRMTSLEDANIRLPEPL